jgi:hypothetical protein
MPLPRTERSCLMSRLSLVLAALVVVSGCKSSGPSGNASDPFFGRTRVAPPATGTVAGPSGSVPYFATQPSQQNPLRSPGGSPGTAPPWTPPAAQLQPSPLPQPSLSPQLTPSPQPTPSLQPAPSLQPTQSPSWLPPQPGPAPASAQGASPGGQPGLMGGVSQTTLTGDRIVIPVSATAAAATPGTSPPPPATSPPPPATQSLGTPNPVATAAIPPSVVNGPQPVGSVYGPTPAGTLATRERIERTLPPRALGSANYLRNAPGPLDPAPQPSRPPQPNQTRAPVNLTDLPESPPNAS